MSQIKNHFHDEIEQRAAWQDCRNDNEFFEQLDEAGIGEVTWNQSLNADYGIWQYLNLK